MTANVTTHELLETLRAKRLDRKLSADEMEAATYDYMRQASIAHALGQMVCADSPVILELYEAVIDVILEIGLMAASSEDLMRLSHGSEMKRVGRAAEDLFDKFNFLIRPARAGETPLKTSTMS